MNYSYPLFLQPKKLHDLNNRALTNIGFPLFLCSIERSRPNTSEAVGALYEVVTGLYIIYHDYGSRFLKEFRSFCKMENRSVALCDHYEDEFSKDNKHLSMVNKLRTGICHGIFPNTNDATNYICTLKQLSKVRQFVKWPEFPAQLHLEQCSEILNNLTDGANNLYNHLWQDIETISLRPGLPEKFCEQLKEHLLNIDRPNWNNEYFDRRILKQVRGCSVQNLPVAEQMIVRCWLKYLVDDLQAKEIKDCDAPIIQLQDLYRQVCAGNVVIDEKSLRKLRPKTLGPRSSSSVLGDDLSL